MPLTAMLNKEGKLVTSNEDIKKTAMEHFKDVLKNRPINPDLEEYKENREQLCEQRIKNASKNVTPD